MANSCLYTEITKKKRKNSNTFNVSISKLSAMNWNQIDHQIFSAILSFLEKSVDSCQHASQICMCMVFRILACDTTCVCDCVCVNFYTRRILIFKTGITVILCLVFIFRRIRRGNIQYIIARRCASATGYLSQYFIGIHIAISLSGACRQQRNSDVFHENPLHLRDTTRRCMLPRVRSWINVWQSRTSRTGNI